MAPILETREAPMANGNGTSRSVKRYQLALPTALYDRVHRAADERDVTVVQLLRAFIKLGLLVLEAEKHPNYELILRTEEGEKHLVLV
jgi:hypothetical protein